MRYLTIILSIVACGWSALTYVFFGMPDDKKDRSYFKHGLGFFAPDPAVVEAWALLKEDYSFHHLKNLLVEWTRADPQRAAKLLALLVLILLVIEALTIAAAVAL